MKFPARIAVWLLPLLLAGCFHRTQQAKVQPLAPPIEDTPPPKPSPKPTDLPPPVISVPNQTPAQGEQAAAEPLPKPKPPVRHKKTPATGSQPAPNTSNSQVASNGTPSVSAIGKLSSGDPSDLKRETANSISAIEHSLNSIDRKLNDQETKTAGQIREYLKQARAALVSGDVDGAHTLAAKAKVLLGELSR
jgi:outer membrane biosynthesis protein TonB